VHEHVVVDIENAPEGGLWAICPEVPGANGQGETAEEAKNSLRQAIEWGHSMEPCYGAGSWVRDLWDGQP
jgi:predicted RNase H-like HicB family nuclease